MPNTVLARPLVRPTSARPASMPATVPLRTALALIATLAALSGCSDRMRLNPLDNQSPEVLLEPARAPDKQPDGATHLVEWHGHDADGRVDHFRVAINPRTLDDDDPAWMATDAPRHSVFAARRAGIGAAERARDEGAVAAGDRDFDLIAVQAVDDRGAHSQPAVRAFFGENVAPTVRITSPRPVQFNPVSVPPTMTIRFNGTDSDGATGEPAHYKSIVLDRDSDFLITLAIQNPDSLRRYYAPGFEGWTTVEHEAGVGGAVTLTDLELGDVCLFVVVAFDEEGAYSPVFSLNTNMLRMRVVHAEWLGPLISLVTDVTSWSPPSPGIPGQTVVLEYPSGVPIALSWSARSLSGVPGLQYRWVLDAKDLGKEFKRPRAGNDLHHWRPWSPDLTSATIGPFKGGETHMFVVEAQDELGRTRLTARIHTVDRQYEADLLIVDDTRFAPDELASGTGCVRPPIGQWPSAAELDTFLFARGNVPWRCYPGGTISPPGLFAGYEFDTLGTLTTTNDPTVPLEVLNRYRHVVWIVDSPAATFQRPPWLPFEPTTALRYMSAPGRLNTLAAYIRGGGKVWLLGGGAGAATMLPWNYSNNDGAGITLSNASGELVPGRFMYDFVHWRSEFKVVSAGGFVNRDIGRSPAWPGAPNYGLLPTQMRMRTAANSPVPPLRTPATYYRTTVDAEYLSLQNFVIEDGASVLDSLYRFDSFQLPTFSGKRVCMSYYHGHENPPVMFSGFDLWSFVRADCQTLVDFVLQNVWGLPKRVPAEPLVKAAP